MTTTAILLDQQTQAQQKKPNAASLAASERWARHRQKEELRVQQQREMLEKKQQELEKIESDRREQIQRMEADKTEKKRKREEKKELKERLLKERQQLHEAYIQEMVSGIDYQVPEQPCTQRAEQTCTTIQNNEFVKERTKARRQLAQTKRRCLESEPNQDNFKKQKTTRQPSLARSLAAKARWEKTRQQKTCQQAAITHTQNVADDEQGILVEQREVNIHVQLPENGEKTMVQAQTIAQTAPTKRKKKQNRPTTAHQEPTIADTDGACCDQMDLGGMQTSVHKDSDPVIAIENTNEMSYPPPDESSDDYSDHYYSSDDNVPNDPVTVPRAARKVRNQKKNVDTNGRNYLGKMDVECPYCGALHWIDEKTSRSSFKYPEFSKCCHKGKVKLPLLRMPPQALRALYEGEDSRSKLFRKNIRNYNSANAYTSLGCKYDTRAKKGRGPQCFAIHGELRHLSGSLTPIKEEDAIYSQLYIYDPARALQIRQDRNPDLSKEVLETIQNTLIQHNVFRPLYKHANEILKEKQSTSEETVQQVSLHFNENSDRRRYNLPTVEEVSVIVPETPSDTSTTRDILLHLKDGNGYTRIDECHPAYLPLLF